MAESAEDDNLIYSAWEPVEEVNIPGFMPLQQVGASKDDIDNMSSLIKLSSQDLYQSLRHSMTLSADETVPFRPIYVESESIRLPRESYREKVAPSRDTFTDPYVPSSDPIEGLLATTESTDAAIHYGDNSPNRESSTGEVLPQSGDIAYTGGNYPQTGDAYAGTHDFSGGYNAGTNASPGDYYTQTNAAPGDYYAKTNAPPGDYYVNTNASPGDYGTDAFPGESYLPTNAAFEDTVSGHNAPSGEAFTGTDTSSRNFYSGTDEAYQDTYIGTNAPPVDPYARTHSRPGDSNAGIFTFSKDLYGDELIAPIANSPYGDPYLNEEPYSGNHLGRKVAALTGTRPARETAAVSAHSSEQSGVTEYNEYTVDLTEKTQLPRGEDDTVFGLVEENEPEHEGLVTNRDTFHHFKEIIKNL
jgi:hypothetical protein